MAIKANKSFISELNALGLSATVDSNSNHVSIETRLGPALGLIEKTDFPKNKARIEEFKSDNKESWRGGTYKELIESLGGKVDMAPYREAYSDFMRSNLANKLKTGLSGIESKRSRRMSDKDGEWSYDRRWDMTPFQESYKKPQPVRSIELDAGFSISSYANAEDINRYGVTIWAISELLESSGIQTGITLVITCKGIDSKSEVSTSVRIRLKEPYEYLAPHLLATTLCCNFFRRVGFTLLVAAPEAISRLANDGLGHVVNRSAIEFKDGVLLLGPSAHSGYDKQIESEVKKAIGA